MLTTRSNKASSNASLVNWQPIWQVLAYSMPEEVAVLHKVVRDGFSRDLADPLLGDLLNAVAFPEKNPPVQPYPQAPVFTH